VISGLDIEFFHRIAILHLASNCRPAQGQHHCVQLGYSPQRRCYQLFLMGLPYLAVFLWLKSATAQASCDPLAATCGEGAESAVKGKSMLAKKNRRKTMMDGRYGGEEQEPLQVNNSGQLEPYNVEKKEWEQVRPYNVYIKQPAEEQGEYWSRMAKLNACDLVQKGCVTLDDLKYRGNVEPLMDGLRYDGCISKPNPADEAAYMAAATVAGVTATIAAGVASGGLAGGAAGAAVLGAAQALNSAIMKTTSCLKWAQHCYAGRIEIPKGIQVTLFHLTGKWDNACSGNKKNSFWEKQYMTEKEEEEFDFWDRQEKRHRRICAFLFEIKPGWTCDAKNSLVPPPTPAPTPGANRPWVIKATRNKGNMNWFWQARNLCLDVYGGQLQKPEKLILWPCSGTSNQLFTWEKPFIKLSKNKMFCLNVYGGAKMLKDGSPVGTWPCKSPEMNDQWEFTAHGMKVAGKENLCLGFGEWCRGRLCKQAQNGTQLTLQPCWNGKGIGYSHILKWVRPPVLEAKEQ